jgi:hypothetical protein
VGSGLDGLVDGSLQARLVSHDEQEIVRFPAPDLRGSCDVAGSSTLGVGGVAGDHGADFATAELVKVAANAFLATKISFINAVAEVCEVAGADVTQVAEAIGHD